MSGTRVLHYAPSLHLSGGVRNYVLGLVALQTERGLDAVLAAPDPRPGDPARPGGLARAIREVRPDVVHLHGGQLLDEEEWWPGPVVSTVHGHGLYCPAGTKWSPGLGACQIVPSVRDCSVTMLRHQCGSRRPWVMTASLRRHAALREQRAQAHQHCISEYVAARVRESGYRPGGGLSVIYAAVPGTRTDESSADTYDLLFAGRLVPSKGADVLLRAVAGSRLRPRLAVLGEGPERPRLEELATGLGVAAQVDFLGWRTQEEVAALHTPRTLLVVPSQWPEPAGLVAAEAAARGRACLVSDRGGLPELVPSPDQVVVADDGAAWTAAIDRALVDEAWLTSRGAAARTLWAERCDPDVVVPAFATLYESVRDRGGQGGGTHPPRLR